MKNILAKLLKVQMTLRPIIKDDVNPHFKNRYFDINTLLATVKPILSENGLVLVQPLDKNTLSTNIYDSESGEYLGSTVNLPEVTDPQKMGSVISYFRRYSLVSLLAIEGDEDDDANTASAVAVPKASVASPSAPQSTQVPKTVSTTKHCAVCNTEFMPDPQYPNGINCSGVCGKKYKAGERYTPPAELPVIQQEEIALSDLPF